MRKKEPLRVLQLVQALERSLQAPRARLLVAWLEPSLADPVSLIPVRAGEMNSAIVIAVIATKPTL